jgi:hypothetical protein
MSKVFYDRLISLEQLEKEIKKHAKTKEEREELYELVDEMIHHKVVGCILDKLPNNHHKEFLTKFAKRPYDDGLMDYLKEKIVDDVEEFIRAEINSLAVELLKIVEATTRPSKSTKKLLN